MERGQIWIETVLYTLMGIALIGVVLAIAMPKINEYRDTLVVEQSIDSLKRWDLKMKEALDSGEGNVRSVDSFTMQRGELWINSTSDQIIFLINDLEAPYSEAGFEIMEGNVRITSEGGEESPSVRLTLNYTNVANILYNGDDVNQKFTAASTAYSFLLKNVGGSDIAGGDDRVSIDIQEVTRR